MQQRWRLVLRIISLICAILPFLPFTEWPKAMAYVEAVSPFISLSAALGSRTVSLITAVCLPLVILAIFKQRWFCSHLCPTGFLLELASFRRRDRRGFTARFPNIANWLLFLGIGMAAAGYPLLMAFDTLAILSGFLSTWQWRNLEWFAFIPALPFLVLIVLNIIWPNLWCQRLCPLGATQHFLGMPLKKFNKTQTQQKTLFADFAQEGELNESFCRSGVNRRYFLLVLSGGIAGLLLKSKKTIASPAFVRPPGAMNENSFTGICTRCGNCVNVCPEGIILPDFGSSGIHGLFTPVLKFDRGYCNEWCSKCVDVCPTAALRRLSLEQKRLTAIGTARIDKSLCLSWTNRQHCMVCQEFCPYQAIEIVQNGGVNCPEVNEAACRGCGACQNNCPAIPVRAITVRGISVQRSINPDLQPELSAGFDVF